MIDSIYNHDDYFKIELMLGNVCNFRCNYCFPGSNEGTDLWPDIEKIKKNLNHLLTYYNRKTRLYIIGGEPTLWNNLGDLCSSLKLQHDVIINISTNASQSLRWWEQHYRYFDVINISVHHEYSNISHCADVADFLYEKNVDVNADVLMDPLEFDKCLAIVDQLSTSKHQWPIIAKTVLFNGKTKYTEQQAQHVSNPIKRYPDMNWYNAVSKKPRTTISIDNSVIHNDNWFALNNQNHFYRWKCNIGVDLIKIDSNGLIHSNCGEYLYNTDIKYNLYDDDFVNKFQPEISPVVCSKHICPCSGEAATTKWRQNV